MMRGVRCDHAMPDHAGRRPKCEQIVQVGMPVLACSQLAARFEVQVVGGVIPSDTGPYGLVFKLIEVGFHHEQKASTTT